MSRGQDFGIPLCCRLRFAWDIAFGDTLAPKKRGCCVRGPDDRFIVCGIFHRLSSDA